MATGPPSPPSGASIGPFSASAVGLATVAVAGVGATGYQFLALVSGLQATNRGWLAFVALAALGGALVLWDRLTDAFEESHP